MVLITWTLGTSRLPGTTKLTPSAHALVEDVEGHTGIPVSFIGTGPTNEEIIDRREPSFLLTTPAANYSVA